MTGADGWPGVWMNERTASRGYDDKSRAASVAGLICLVLPLILFLHLLVLHGDTVAVTLGQITTVLSSLGALTASLRLISTCLDLGYTPCLAG